MLQTSPLPSDGRPVCPKCHRALSCVASWDFCGLWGYYEMRTYECPEHGPVFISPRTAEPLRPERTTSQFVEVERTEE